MNRLSDDGGLSGTIFEAAMIDIKLDVFYLNELSFVPVGSDSIVY